MIALSRFIENLKGIRPGMLDMAVVISQPRFLPAANIFHRMNIVDTLVYLDIVQYTKRDYENRTRIRSGDKSQWLTVPVVHTSRNQRILDTKIDDSQKWQIKHQKTLVAAYGKCPYFREIEPLLEEVFSRKWTYLLDLNLFIIDQLCALLGIHCKTVRASELLRNQTALTGEDLLMNVCQILGESSYLSGSNGREYINHERWTKAKIEVRYHDYAPQPYPQGRLEFEPWLSIVDMVSHVGLKSAVQVISENQGSHYQEMPLQ
jgi:hypothetical protein